MLQQPPQTDIRGPRRGKFETDPPTHDNNQRFSGGSPQGELQYKEEELQDVRQQLRAAESCTAELQEALQIEKEKLIALLMEPLRKPVAEKGGGFAFFC